MAMSAMATEQIQRQVDKSLEPKLEVLLAKKVRTSALKTKPSKKDQHHKFKTLSSNTREQFAKRRLDHENIQVTLNLSLQNLLKEIMVRNFPMKKQKIQIWDCFRERV